MFTTQVTLDMTKEASMALKSFKENEKKKSFSENKFSYLFKIGATMQF